MLPAVPPPVLAPPVPAEPPAPAEPPKDAAPAVASQANSEAVAPARTQAPETVVPRARPSDLVRQPIETAVPAAPPSAAAAIAAPPVEASQARPLPGVVATIPPEQAYLPLSVSTCPLVKKS